MPALRNRRHLIDGAEGKASQGYIDGQVSDIKLGQNDVEGEILNKKLMFMREEEANNLHDGNNNRGDTSNLEDTFMDTNTVDAHAKFEQLEPQIFDQNNSSIGQSARDQFAVALLRLQADLDSTGQRLAQIESKVDKLNLNKQRAGKTTDAGRGDKRSGLFGGNNMSTIMYLSWPLIVFVAMRAIERRSLSGKLS